MRRVDDTLERVEDKVDKTNGSVLRHGEIFHGPADPSGHHTGRGLLYEVRDQGEKTSQEIRLLRTDVNALAKETTGMTAAEIKSGQVWRIVLTAGAVMIAAVGVLVSVLIAL